MNIRIGHSPDADDAFLFYAMTQGKIDLDGIQVTHCMEGIEQLNDRAIRGELEMTAISLHAYPYCAGQYLLLPTGASVGDGVGPVVVAREDLSLEGLRKKVVAIPGKRTTAALLFQLAVGKCALKVLPFDQILEAVKEGQVDAGVLIHEGQLTYAEQGLRKVLDLGVWWQAQTRLPVPLGINVIRRSLGTQAIQKVASTFKRSLDYAFAHREEALRYAQGFSRGLDMARTDGFVGMYVNRWSVECRPEGAAAMQRLLDWAAREKLVPHRVPLEFIEG